MNGRSVRSIGGDPADSATHWPDSLSVVLVLAPGTRVGLGPKRETPGTITEVILGGSGAVRYHVAWWVGNERKTEWLELHELCTDAAAAQKMQIGFHNQPGSLGYD